MKIWKKDLSLDALNQACENTAISYLGIQFTAFGDDWLEATMPITEKCTQPLGWLHGGVSCVLAETVGSLAGVCAVEAPFITVGAEINASHLRPIKQGDTARAVATPLKLGRTLHSWQIDIFNNANKLCCRSRLTVSVINPEQ